jgi:hypothetical protein
VRELFSVLRYRIVAPSRRVRPHKRLGAATRLKPIAQQMRSFGVGVFRRLKVDFPSLFRRAARIARRVHLMPSFPEREERFTSQFHLSASNLTLRDWDMIDWKLYLAGAAAVISAAIAIATLVYLSAH